MRASCVTLAAMLLAGCAGGPPGGPAPGRPTAHRGDRAGRPPSDFAPPGFARMRTFISPMGEPLRGDPGGLAPPAAWFAGADADHDGRLTRAEFEADALRFFATLDTDRDGEIGPSELDNYEERIAPEVRAGESGGFGGGRADGGGRPGRGDRSGGGRPGGRSGGGPPGGGRPPGDEAAAGGGHAPGGEVRQGAARFGYLDLPEPVIAADTDFNRGVSRAEFVAAARKRFLLLDRDGDGVLTEAELPQLGGGRR